MPLQWIVFAGLFFVSAIFAAVTTYWPDIVAQPPSAAAFLGALAGAGGGLLAIILGALLNAELNRRRDDRLRAQETRALCLALASEMQGIGGAARHQASLLRRFVDDDIAEFLGLIETPRATVFAGNADKIGWIADTARDEIFATVVAIEQIIAAVRVLLLIPDAGGVSASTCTALAGRFDALAEAADKTAKTLRDAAGPKASTK